MGKVWRIKYITHGGHGDDGGAHGHGHGHGHARDGPQTPLKKACEESAKVKLESTDAIIGTNTRIR